MAYARKKDTTHQIVVDALRVYGWTVLDVSRAPLCVDLVIARQQRVVLVEVKDRLGKLTEAQKALLAHWPNETAVLRSLEDVARLTADAPVRVSAGVSRSRGPDSPRRPS